MNVDREEDGAGSKTRVEAIERGTLDGNENGRRGTGSRCVEERRICARKPRRVVDIMWEMGKTWAKAEKTKHESIGSIAANYYYIENSKEAGSETQRTQGLSKNCRCKGSVSSLSRLMTSFRNKYN